MKLPPHLRTLRRRWIDAEALAVELETSTRAGPGYWTAEAAHAAQLAADLCSEYEEAYREWRLGLVAGVTA